MYFYFLKIQEKNKIALTLVLVFSIILLTNWFVAYHIDKINSEFDSIYNDRLIPAVDISGIMAKSFQNQLLIEEHIISKDSRNSKLIEVKIQENIRQIDYLIHKFEKTYMVNEESQYLISYLDKIKKHRKLEKKIIDLSSRNLKNSANSLFFNENEKLFVEVVEQIQKLIHIQATIGKDLLQDSRARVSNILILLQLSFVISFIISIIIILLLNSSLAIYNNKNRTNDFNLN